MTLTRRSLLPMLGHTKGSRSATVCHYKCGDACAKPVPNTSDNTYFRDVASSALSRRAVLGGAGAGALALAFGGHVAGADGAMAAHLGPSRSRSRLPFQRIAPVPNTVDDVKVPRGYDWSTIIRWGDPILDGAPEFNIDAQTPQSQAGQFGYNNDYLDIIPFASHGKGDDDDDDDDGRRALLVANHEYTNESLMFREPGAADDLERQIRIGLAAHGMSVVEVARKGRRGGWRYRKDSDYNRRITAMTPMEFDGPAAGSRLLRTAADSSGRRVLGTLNNCAGGTTPWGTVLSGEENFNQYFVTSGTPAEIRYGMPASTSSERLWEQVETRFDARAGTGYENEPNRFGWVVELDPFDPDSTPVKHTALGRFKHESATISVAPDGRVVAYSGDDERFDYVYKFVSSGTMQPGTSAKARRANKTLLSDGDLYVARFTGDSPGEIDGTGRLPTDGEFDGTGQWLPLVVSGKSAVTGFSLEEVLVFTRLAADTVGATKMDRPEDVEPNPATGRVYIACTNNTRRIAAEADEPNPRAANKDGHVVELIEDGDNPTSLTFAWNLLLVCGDEASAGTYFGGYAGDVSPIACPDNLAFDSEGNLWISTDGQPGTIGLNDALHKVPLVGDQRGFVQQFLAVPVGAETCGPKVDLKHQMVYVAVQHPGDVEGASVDAPASYFPDYVRGRRVKRGQYAGPRPSVVQVFRD